VISVGDLSALKIVTNAPRLYVGSHLSMPEVSHTLARRLILRTSTLGPQVGLEIDGELLGHLPATFQVVPEALLVRCNV